MFYTEGKTVQIKRSIVKHSGLNEKINGERYYFLELGSSSLNGPGKIKLYSSNIQALQESTREFVKQSKKSQQIHPPRGAYAALSKHSNSPSDPAGQDYSEYEDVQCPIASSSACKAPKGSGGLHQIFQAMIIASDEEDTTSEYEYEYYEPSIDPNLKWHQNRNAVTEYADQYFAEIQPGDDERHIKVKDESTTLEHLFERTNSRELGAMAKERDNTWLQLPVCPTEFKGQGEKCTLTPDQCPYAHLPDHVKPLPCGYVVSCHDFVFSHGPNKRGCTRNACRYFHPPMHLRLSVINAGKNNKRIRSELLKQTGVGGGAGIFSTPMMISPTSSLQPGAGLYYSQAGLLSWPTQWPVQNHTASSTALAAGLAPEMPPSLYLAQSFKPMPIPSNLAVNGFRSERITDPALMDTAAPHTRGAKDPANTTLNDPEPEPPGVGGAHESPSRKRNYSPDKYVSPETKRITLANSFAARAPMADLNLGWSAALQADYCQQQLALYHQQQLAMNYHPLQIHPQAPTTLWPPSYPFAMP
eukprot:maker-scaffold699_size109694-snap-gene-0.18 protein:Tk03216 transcript:maker-scaffold699_size109694-snap-gene-0.18-mRNA-1 annotation:"GF11449"